MSVAFSLSSEPTKTDARRVLFLTTEEDHSVPDEVLVDPSPEELSSEDENMPTYRVLAPPKIREYRSRGHKALVEDMNKECVEENKPLCAYCGTHLCIHRWDVTLARCRMERDGVIEVDKIYDGSPEELKGNALRRQLLYEEYWHSSRKTYKTDTWSSDDFMFLPQCAIYCARMFFPAPLDLRRIPFAMDDGDFDLCNKGLQPLKPIFGIVPIEDEYEGLTPISDATSRLNDCDEFELEDFHYYDEIEHEDFH